jgi:tRNA modification GTPase
VSGDVVVAPATARGLAALAVVRLSGDGVVDVVARVARPRVASAPAFGRQVRVDFFDELGVFDDGTCVLGRAPRTFTGEDTAELTCHGAPLVVDRLVAALVRAGARLAEPGAFTRRAMASGKVDLVAAEGVLALGAARSRRGLSVTRSAIDGRLSAFLHDQRASLLTCAAELEARLDYPGDELALEDDEVVAGRLRAVARACDEVAARWAPGRIAVEGARVALVGAVNAGKSSLFNALVGAPRALVHSSPGTTRDVVSERVALGPFEVTLFDTAGERVTDDPVEAAGQALSAQWVARADVLVVVLRATPGGPSEVERALLARTDGRQRVVVLNGVDAPHGPIDGAISTIAPDGVGVAEVARAVTDALVAIGEVGDDLSVTSGRQHDRLCATARAAEDAAGALPFAGPAVAASLVVEGLAALDELEGRVVREQVLDALFARFCIGK